MTQDTGRPPLRDEKPHYLYRLFDGTDSLLYVGVTRSVQHRRYQHAHTQPWWAEVARHTAEEYPNRYSALMAEQEAIKLEEPKYNIRHSNHRKIGLADRHHSVYWVHGRYNRLLYVGLTSDLPNRLRHHQQLSKWWHEAKTIRLEHFPDRAKARVAEYAAINRLRPLYNYLPANRVVVDEEIKPAS